MPVNRKVFCFWTGRNPMSDQRSACLQSMRDNLGVPVELVFWRDLDRYILPEAPLHPGFRYLSCTHRSDYLRCYFMHFHGGGYADIKPYTRANNWRLCFDIIDHFAQIDIIGQPEIINGTPIPEFNPNAAGIPEVFRFGEECGTSLVSSSPHHANSRAHSAPACQIYPCTQ